MKKIILVCSVLAMFSSCITVNLNGHKLTEDVKQYDSLLLIFTDSDDTFFEWNEENYNYVINTRFNGLDQERNREKFAYHIRKYFNGTKIFNASQVFPLHKPIDYADFMHQIENINFDAILLVHSKGEWIHERVSDGDTVTKLNAEYHIFLIDKYDYQNVWIAKSDAVGSGGWNQFSDLYERISMDLASKLKENGFIY